MLVSKSRTLMAACALLGIYVAFLISYKSAGEGNDFSSVVSIRYRTIVLQTNPVRSVNHSNRKDLCRSHCRGGVVVWMGGAPCGRPSRSTTPHKNLTHALIQIALKKSPTDIII